MQQLVETPSSARIRALDVRLHEDKNAATDQHKSAHSLEESIACSRLGKMVIFNQEKEVDGQGFDQNSDFLDEACCVRGVVVVAELCCRPEAASDCGLQGYHQDGKSFNLQGMAYVEQ